MYDQRPLMRALREQFGEQELGSAELETGLAIFAKAMGQGSDYDASLFQLLAERDRGPKELFDELADWLQIWAVAPPSERRYVDRLAKFVREWEPKSTTKRLAELIEYLDYFEQAGGKIEIEQDADDAVQLMTVHAAKGLEFDHVFVLRLTHRAFPAPERTNVLDFPAALMKEELPKHPSEYHIEEERR